MDEGGRHLRPSDGADEQPASRPAADEYEWVEERPRPAQQSRPANGQRPAQQGRPASSQHPAQQGRPANSQRPAQQGRPANSQRPAQQGRPASNQRPAQQSRPANGQRMPQQGRTPAGQRPARQDRPPRQPSQRRVQPPSEEPWREQPAREVAVDPPGYKHKRRWLSKQNLPLILLVVILLGGVLFAGGKLLSIALDYHRDRSAYRDLADSVLSGLADPNATMSPDGTIPEGPVQSEVPISVDWDALKAINSEIVGWLYCPGKLNYPVVQTTDNDYYLHRSFDEQPNVSGTLFIDTASTLGSAFNNLIIYGHNMKDGSMFALLDDYMDQEYYNENPVMYFLTPEQSYRVDLISGHLVESSLDNYPYYFDGEDEYREYLDYILSRSFFITNAEVSTQYQLLTMSTCNYSSNFRDPRCLLQGLMVPIQ